MRLCVISHAYLELGYRHVLDALAAYPGIRLAWVTPDSYKGVTKVSSAECPETGELFATYAVPIRWGARQGAFVYNLKLLSEAIDDFQPDIILHEQEVFALGAAQVAYIAKQRKLPLVMFVNENVYRSLAPPRRWLSHYVLKNSTGLIPISEGAAEVHHTWGFRGPSAIIAQMGVRSHPNPRFGPRAKDGIHVCFAGRLISMKGVDCLLRAVAVLRSEGVPFRCTIAGSGNRQESLHSLSRKLGVEESVEFTGMLAPDAVVALLQNSDVLVLPSRRTPAWEEQFGRVLVEAMAEATIALGSRTGAIGEVIGSNDLLFDEDDYVALARILKNLATDPKLLEEKQRYAWDRARDCYESSVVTRRKVLFLEEVLHGVRRSA